VGHDGLAFERACCEFRDGGGGAFLPRVCRILLVGRLAGHRVWAVFIACCCWERITGCVFDTYIAVIVGFRDTLSL